MDLERLKIDRSAPARRRRAGGPWFGRLIVLGVLAALVWLFWKPLSGFADRVRLPEVAVLRVARSSPLAASAVSGTAASGYVVARHRAALSADAPGRIVEMNVEEGSVVREGDIVARLYSEEFEAALRGAEADLEGAKASRVRAVAEAEAAKARLDELRSRATATNASLEEARAAERLAETNHARAVQLLEERVVSQERVDSTLAELEQARARVAASEASVAEAAASLASGESNLAVQEAGVQEADARIPSSEAARDLARATLEKTFVRAPFDGVVVLKDAEIGEVVSPNSMGSQSRGSVVTMVDFASLEVQVELPETSLSAVAEGIPANIYLDAFPEHLYRGSVSRIWPTANRQKATVEVRVVFEETDERLRPEMGARVVFSPGEAPSIESSDEPGRILIPSQCVVRIDGADGVFVLERDVARFRPVTIRTGSSGRVLVEAGLDEGDRIVADPPSSLADGDRIREKART